MPNPHPRIVELKEKQQRAGLTPSERLELVALEDQVDRLEQMKSSGPQTVFLPGEKSTDEQASSKAKPDDVAVARVQARVTGREAGEAIASSIEDALVKIRTGDAEKARRAEESFWRAILEQHQEKLIPMKEQQSLPMTKREALEWQTSQVMLGRGQYAGQGIEDVPLPYLRAIDNDEQWEQFRRELRRYLNSGLRDQ